MCICISWIHLSHRFMFTIFCNCREVNNPSIGCDNIFCISVLLQFNLSLRCLLCTLCYIESMITAHLKDMMQLMLSWGANEIIRRAAIPICSLQTLRCGQRSVSSHRHLVANLHHCLFMCRQKESPTCQRITKTCSLNHCFILCFYIKVTIFNAAGFNKTVLLWYLYCFYMSYYTVYQINLAFYLFLKLNLGLIHFYFLRCN